MFVGGAGLRVARLPLIVTLILESGAILQQKQKRALACARSHARARARARVEKIKSPQNGPEVLKWNATRKAQQFGGVTRGCYVKYKCISDQLDFLVSGWGVRIF